MSDPKKDKPESDVGARKPGDAPEKAKSGGSGGAHKPADAPEKATGGGTSAHKPADAPEKATGGGTSAHKPADAPEKAKGDEPRAQGSGSGTTAAEKERTTPEASELDLVLQSGGVKPPAPPPPARHGSGGRAGLWLVVLLLLVLAGATAAGGWWLWERQEALADAQTGLASDLELAELRDSLRSRADRLEGRVDNLATEHQQHVQQLARAEEAMASVRERQARSDDRMERIEELAAAHHRDWILSEVDYLFGVARYRVRFHRDVNGGLAALREADKLLGRLGADTIEQRQQLRKAIDALLDVQRPDREALTADLGGLIAAVDDWPIAQPETRIRSKPIEGQPDADLSTVEGWRAAGARAWQQFRESLSSLVVVRRDDPVPPLVSPEQGWFLRENVRLQLQVARLALLEEDADTWRESLLQAQAWLQRHFDADDAQVREAADALGALVEKRVSADMPDLDDLLPRMRPERGEEES